MATQAELSCSSRGPPCASPTRHALSCRPPPARLVLRQQHGADDGGALADVGEEGEDKGLGVLAKHVPAGVGGRGAVVSGG